MQNYQLLEPKYALLDDPEGRVFAGGALRPRLC